MDILPPPGFESVTLSPEEKKKLKKNRYKENKKRKKALSSTNVSTENDSLKTKLHDKLQGLQQRRNGEAQKKASNIKKQLNLKRGQVNPQKLLEHLGITDPGIKEKVLEMLRSGQITDIESLVTQIKNIAK